MQRSPENNMVFVARASLSLYFVFGFFCAVFLAIFLWIGFKKNDWTGAFVVSAIVIVGAGCLRWLRLEITQDEIHYRNLSSNVHLRFDEIEGAYFDVLQAAKAPQGVARFWIKPRTESARKINLKTFPLRASAVLFS